MQHEAADPLVGQLVCATWGKGRGTRLEAYVSEVSAENGVRCHVEQAERQDLIGATVWLPADRVRPLPLPRRYLVVSTTIYPQTNEPPD